MTFGNTPWRPLRRCWSAIRRRLEEYSLEQLAAVLAGCVRARYTPTELLLPLQLRLKSEARGDMQVRTLLCRRSAASRVSARRHPLPRACRRKARCRMRPLA